jgi:hypothetical protein
MSDERTPTAEPVTVAAQGLLSFLVSKGFPEVNVRNSMLAIEAEAAQRSKESLIAEGKTIMRLDTVRDLTARAEAAQRSTAEVERLRELNVESPRQLPV